MIKVKVNLQPLVNRLNLPTVLKTTILPGESTERLFSFLDLTRVPLGP